MDSRDIGEFRRWVTKEEVGRCDGMSHPVGILLDNFSSWTCADLKSEVEG